MPCIYISPPVRELASKFPHETLSSVRNMVGIWMERKMAEGDSSVTVDSVPSVSVLQGEFLRVRKSGQKEFVTDKETLDELLDEEHEFPDSLVSLAERLGVSIKRNRKTHTITISSNGGTDSDLRLFRALAVDYIYQSEAAEEVFGMTPRERLAALIDWENIYRKKKDVATRRLMDYEIQFAKRNLRDRYEISTDGEMEAMRKQAAEQFTSKERLERISDIVYQFDKLLTERHEGRLAELAARRDELIRAKEEKDRSKYPGIPEMEEAERQRQALLDTELSDLGLSVRASKRLEEHKFKTVRDIVQYNRPVFQKKANLDSKSLKEIVDLVDRLGLSFGMAVTSGSAEASLKWETVEAAYDRELGDLQRQIGSYSRMKALKEYGPDNILYDIRQKFADLAAISDDAEFIRRLGRDFRVHPQFAKENLAWYRKQVRAVVDNFLVLADEASRELEVTELVRINLRQSDATEVLDGEMHQEENEEGREEDSVEGIENQYKESWMFEYDTTSNWSKTPVQVRRLLSMLPLGSRNTRFGSPYRMQTMHVMNMLIDEMQGVNTSEEMDELFEALKRDNPWLEEIIRRIAADSQLKTNLFLSITRYSQTLGIIERSDSKSSSRDMTKSRLKIVNSGKTVNSIYAGIEYQISSGVPLNKRMSIYHDEVLDDDGINMVLDVLDSYSDEEWTRILSAEPSEVSKLRSEFPNLIRDIKNLLNAIGVSVTEADVRVIAARDVRDRMTSYHNNLGGLLKLIDKLIEQLNENDYRTIRDLIDEDRNAPGRSVMRYYRDISKLLTLTDRAAIEPSTREKGKVRYSNVLRSTLDDLIVGLQGRRFSHIRWNESHTSGERVNMTPAEYVIAKFGEDPSFATKTVHEDGTVSYHFRNHILEEIVNGDSYYTPAYVTILDADTETRDKMEQKHLTQTDRLNMMWSMYHMTENADSRYENTQGYWFPIPLPSDSGRIAYISFLPVASRERQDEIIKEAIIKELERMTDDSYPAYDEEKERDNPVVSDVPLTLRKNKGKFCTFPFLNSVAIAKYSVNDIRQAYLEAHRLRQFSKFNQILEDLVGVVRTAIVEKFEEENTDFYDARVRELGKEAVDDVLIEESLFQMSMNEILNGDPAYYSGYNTGSDNIQKRAKQSIVPKAKMDMYNADFLEAYKAYHGIDPNAKLSPEQIVEHCLYISDPVMPSPSYDDLVALYDEAYADGIIDKSTRDSFIRSISDIEHTDGQAFRAFESMKMLMYALGEMRKGDAMDQALDRIAKGEQQEGDAEIVLTAKKPFTDGLVPIQNPDGTVRLMPVQHKLSEQVLTAALLQAQGTRIGASPALRALSRFMQEQHLDVVIFTSGVKAGQNGAVEFGEIDPESASEDEIYEAFVRESNKYRSATGRSLVHEIPYSFYGIVAQNPDSGLDESMIPIGTQLQKLISADLPDKIPVKYEEDGKIVTRYEEAKYHVEGVGDLSRSEIIALYNKLMTRLIELEYKKLGGTFDDRAKLSEALMRACRNSSRNSSYLERAFSLDEHGNFVIPLCDMATLNMSSEFLNSVIKNAVSRITIPGKQLVSLSAFGLANSLKVGVEVDENGKHRYSYIECLLPAWSRHIIEKCVDERGVIDFDKMSRENPQLLKMIGTRIPTQFKNFILPLKCVGFLPSILGDSIITAIDSVPMLDADFDNDKVPTLFPVFKADYHIDNWEKVARRDYVAYLKSIYDFSKLKAEYNDKETVAEAYVEKDRGADEDGLSGYGLLDFIYDRREKLGAEEFEKQYRRDDAGEGEYVTFRQYKANHESRYLRPDGPKLNYIAYDPARSMEDQSEEAIINGIISTMFGMLTGRAVSTMSMASGSTEKLKEIKRELEDKIPKKKYTGLDGPADIASRIAQETRNNDGKQMISVFANAEAMQAILQHTHVGLFPGIGATINERKLESLHDMTIDGTLEYISRYIGTALGGAADNAKDPILSVMNINLRTAPVVSLMLQLGYTMREVAFFLNIPSIRHYTDTGKFGKYKEPDMDSLPTVLPGTIERMGKAIEFGDDPDDMDDDLYDYCNTALGVFMYLSGIGERMRNMSSLVRGDSGSTAPHGPIENNLVRFLNYELFKEMEEEDPVFSNWQEVVDYDFFSEASSEQVSAAVNPLAQAYITYGVVGAFRKLSEYYPGIADPNFRKQIKDIIKKYYGGVATVVNTKTVLYSLYNYIESSFDCVRKEGLSIQGSRNYYINHFPEEGARILAEHPELSTSLLFRRLKMYSTLDTVEDGFISLLYEGTMLSETRDEFTAVWQQMFYAKKEDGTVDEEVRQFALDLFKYCYFRNGWRFGPGTYAHLAPAEARLFFPGYNEMIESMQEGLEAEIYKNFELQFVRNNLYDGKFCMFVPQKEFKPHTDREGNILDHLTIPHWSRFKDDAHRDQMRWYFEEGSETARTAFAISTKIDGESVDLYYVKVSEDDTKSTYALTTPLGVKDMAVEYSALEPGLSMPSVYDQGQVATALRAKRFGTRKQSSKSSGRRANQGNSSESPNEDNDDVDFWGRPKSSSRKTSKNTKTSPKGKSKSDKSGKSSKKAKTKQEIKKGRDGGKKTKSKYTIAKDRSSFGRIIDAEVACASGIGTYTISIVDPQSTQFNTRINAAAAKRGKTHFVSRMFDPKSIYEVVNELAEKLRGRSDKSIVLNLTGSYMNTIRNYATQDALDDYVMKIYRALKQKGIYVSKVVSTGQPGIPLASARAAIRLGYNLELHPTEDYKVYGKMGEAPVASKDMFMANIDAGKTSKEYRQSTMIYDREDGPFIIAANEWTRAIVEKDRHTIYVFEDNSNRTSGLHRVSPSSSYAKKYGKMGVLQYPNSGSAVARGAGNAFPISTRKSETEAWEDRDFARFKKVILAEIDDIIAAFEDENLGFKRVVLPVDDLLRDLPEKFHKWFSDRMEELEDRINEIADTEVDEDTDEGGDEGGDAEYNVEVDAEEILSGSDIQPMNFNGKNMEPSNVYVIETDTLSSAGVHLVNSKGEDVNVPRLYVVLPQGEQSAYISHWSKGKIYTDEGYRVTEELFIVPKGSRTRYNLMTAANDEFALALYPDKHLGMKSALGVTLKLTAKIPYREKGLVWLDDNNEPMC